MRECYVDLHVHIGYAQGQFVKVTASRELTIANILDFVPRNKGLSIIGIVDAASPAVQADLRQLFRAGKLQELPGGGLRSGDLCLILGVEMELHLPGRGNAHFLGYFPNMDSLSAFSSELALYLTNPTLSTQTARLSPDDAVKLVTKNDGFLLPAHAFTPHKGVLGCCTTSLDEAFLLELDHIFALELGLSADTHMADSLSSLENFTFVTNSDAHSLPKIGREYMKMALANQDFNSLRQALLGTDRKRNRILANYGMAPKLGKYHRTYCPDCQKIFTGNKETRDTCPLCGSSHLVIGVWDRLQEITDQPSRSPGHRPPYIPQVPLEMLPGVGNKTKERLISQVGPEKYILNDAGRPELTHACGAKVANLILDARNGLLLLQPGGGGKYGKVKLR